MRVKTWSYQMIPSMLFHSYLPPTQENNLVPWSHAPVPCQCKDQLTIWPFCAESDAIKCPTAGFGDCYKGWWNHAFIFGDFRLYKSMYGIKGALMAGSQQRIAGNQSWDGVLDCWGWKQYVKDCHKTNPSWYQWGTGQVLSRYIILSVRVCQNYKVEEYLGVVLKLFGCFLHGTILEGKYSL